MSLFVLTWTLVWPTELDLPVLELEETRRITLWKRSKNTYLKLLFWENVPEWCSGLWRSAFQCCLLLHIPETVHQNLLSHSVVSLSPSGKIKKKKTAQCCDEIINLVSAPSELYQLLHLPDSNVATFLKSFFLWTCSATIDCSQYWEKYNSVSRGDCYFKVLWTLHKFWSLTAGTSSLWWLTGPVHLSLHLEGITHYTDSVFIKETQFLSTNQFKYLIQGLQCCNSWCPKSELQILCLE